MIVEINCDRSTKNVCMFWCLSFSNLFLNPLSGWAMEYHHHHAWTEQICTSVWDSLRARGSWPLLSSRRASRSEGWMRFLRRRMHMCQSQWGLRILQFLVVTCVMVSGWQIPRLSHLMISVVMMVMMRFLKLYLNMVMIGMTLKWWKMIASNVFLYIAHMYFAMCCDCVKCHWTWWHFCWTHVMLHQHGAKLSLP